MSLSYLSEAFKNLEFLEEEDFNLSDKKDLDELNDLIHEEPEDTVEIMSMDFDDLQDTEDQEVEETHVGDVIFDCPVCHSKLYKSSDEVVLDELGEFANVGEECPYCFTADGFKIIGQVAPYQPEDEVTVDIEDKEETEDDSDEVDEEEKEDVEIEESLTESKDVDLTEYQKWVDYDMKKYHKISDDTMNKIKAAGLSVVKDQYGDYEVIADRKVHEGFETASSELIEKSIQSALKNAIGEYPRSIGQIFENNPNLITFIIKDKPEYIRSFSENADQIRRDLNKQLGSMKISGTRTDVDSNKGTIKMTFIDISNQDLGGVQKVREGFEKVELETDDQKITVKSEPRESDPDELMISPIDSEVQDEIEMNTEEAEDEIPEDEIDIDTTEFDEESFDELGESYLKRVYENVNSYKTTKVGMTQDHSRLVVEGVITFGSGNKKNTVFSFIPHDATKSGKVRFLGENLQISRGHKTFILSGKISNNSLLSESLNYNYRTKDIKGNATKVYGTVKVSESLKNKKLKEDKELSGKEGTASNAIVNWWKNYDFSAKNPKQIYDDLVKILPEDKLNEPKVKKLCQEILRAKTGDKAALTIGNFVLKGDKQGVINQRKDK